MTHKKTILKKIRLSGSGVHSGKPVRLALLPSEAGEIIFRRTDLGNLELRIALGRVQSFNSTTLVGDKFKVRTVEHLLASLFAFGINSLDVEIDADEIPIMDGSALPFVLALEKAGTRRLAQKIPSLKILKPFAVQDKGASVIVEPSETGAGLRLSYAIDFANPAIGRRRFERPFTLSAFARDIAPARTFGFVRDVETLRRQGVALGASFENTVVLDDAGVMNGPLRFPDEFVRHKLLDLAGDLALLGRPIIGRFTACKAGHRLHLQVVRFILEHPGLWTEA
jgi:UDP-3-O-[3-hydroxymyristoyl] N-acetylglucosamine deacetylase